MIFYLCNGDGGHRKEKLQKWLEKNHRIKIRGMDTGVIIKNISCKSLRIKNNRGSLKTIRKGKETDLLVEGQSVFIEGKTFHVRAFQ